ncbi:MAG: hypothetical protein IPL29_16035 [Propionivibrio sp.]|nr:hypothetical protein [Propionivibrio sp.]
MTFLKRLFGSTGEASPLGNLRPIEIREALYAVVNAHLEPHGFVRKKTPDTWFRERCDGFLDVVNITTILPENKGPVIANAHVGIHCTELERIKAKIASRRYAVNYPTFTKYVGYIMPQAAFIKWMFPRNKFAEDVATELAATVVKYGLPWFEQFSGMESLKKGITDFGIKQGSFISLAILEDLLSHKDVAIAILDEGISQLMTEKKVDENLVSLAQKLKDFLTN